jgi:hypothetical protein
METPAKAVSAEEPVWSWSNVLKSKKTDNTFFALFKKDSFLIRTACTGLYVSSIFVFWFATNHQYKDAYSLDRTFRSLHIVERDMSIPQSYWTLDWVTHSTKLGNNKPAVSMPVTDKMCIDMATCVDDSLQLKTCTFSCALTANQTRWNNKGNKYDSCQALTGDYAQNACEMERSPEVDLIVNDDKTFSIASGHSQYVLMLYVAFIMFGVNILLWFDTPALQWTLTTYLNIGEYKAKKKVNNLTYPRLFVLVLVLLLAFLHRGLYRAAETTGNRLEGAHDAMPNGSFFYGILSLFAVMWFALIQDDVSDEEAAAANEDEFPKAEVINKNGDPYTQPSPDAFDNSDQKPPGFDLNVSGFSTGRKMKAFMQPGKDKGYELRYLNDLNKSVTLNDKSYENYKCQPFYSIWALTQLWVQPLLVLSVYVVKSGYDIDINVTTIFVATFFMGLIDVFGKRLLELRRLYHSITKEDTLDYSMDVGVRVVYLVGLLIQFMLLWLVFRTANWRFGAWNEPEIYSGIMVGNTRFYEREKITETFSAMWTIYYWVATAYKLAALVPEYNFMGFKTRKIYTNFDDNLFLLLNVFVLAFMWMLWGVGENHRDTLAPYDAGVYLQFIGGILQS